MDLSSCKKEIIELHQFFEDWAKGDIQQNELDRWHCVLAPEVTIVTPEAKMIRKNQLLEMIESGYSKFDTQANQYSIWIEEVSSRKVTSNTFLSTYKEWQIIDGTEQARLSTVLFQKKDNLPNGLLWQHVHETWIST